MRPTEPAGFREAWDIGERLWDGTVARARGMEPALLRESVDAEWSFIEACVTWCSNRRVGAARVAPSAVRRAGPRRSREGPESAGELIGGS